MDTTFVGPSEAGSRKPQARRERATAVIRVIATTLEGTTAALAAAVPLAAGCNAKLVVLVPHLVSYPIEADTAAQPSASFVRAYAKVVRELGGTARVEVVLCRR